jgi:hypothetical protein
MSEPAQHISPEAAQRMVLSSANEDIAGCTKSFGNSTRFIPKRNFGRK